MGCAGRALGAWAVVLTDDDDEAAAAAGGLAAEPLAAWEGGWAVGALDWLEAYPLPSSGPGSRAFAVCGADGGGRLWRWVVMEGGEGGGGQQPPLPWRVAGGRLEGAALPAGAAAHLRAVRGAPGESPKTSKEKKSVLFSLSLSSRVSLSSSPSLFRLTTHDSSSLRVSLSSPSPSMLTAHAINNQSINHSFIHSFIQSTINKS